MKLRTLIQLLVATTVLTVSAARATDPAVEQLLQFIGTSNCDFERNGSQHSAKEAEAHLRLKLSRAGGRVTDAQTFIDRIASKSSWTGQPYHVTCAGERLLTRDWLNDELERLSRQDQ